MHSWVLILVSVNFFVVETDFRSFQNKLIFLLHCTAVSVNKKHYTYYSIIIIQFLLLKYYCNLIITNIYYLY